MCEILKDFTIFSERLEHFVLAYSKKVNLITTTVDSTIMRWNQKVHHGDFSVAAAVVDRLKIKDCKPFSEALLKESRHWPLPISSCAITDQGALSFKLHHPSVFKKVLTSVLQEKDNYGRLAAGWPKDPVGVGIVNNCLLRRERETEGGEREDKEDLTLSQLRGLLLTEHLSALLETAGFQVSHLMPTTCPSSIKLDCFGIRSFQTQGNESSSSRQPKQDTQDRLICAASSCKFRTNGPILGCHKNMTSGQRSREEADTGQASQAIGDSRTDDSSTCADVHLDLHQFIVDEKLPFGKSGYDKNLQKVRVVSANGSPSPVLTQCCLIEEGLNQIHPLPSHVIHVSNQASSFQQQQVDLTWRLCTTPATLHGVHQHHLTHGPVAARRAETMGKEDISAGKLLRIREMQTREASILKYGEEVQGEGWEQLIQRLTIAGLKFEMLGKQCRQMLKLELSNARNSSTWPDSRNGVFVMYNYARLCTLFSNFEKEVAKGTYPALPSISNVDFSLLREEQEWGLLFNYVLQYPVMLTECVRDIVQVKGPLVNIQTHRVCSFLTSLCRDLSSYYSHTHVLGEARPHLLATMFARLYLLEGVQQILKNGLSLLSIQPLTQM